MKIAHKRIQLVLLFTLCLAFAWPSVADAQRRRRAQQSRYPVLVGAEHPDFKLPNVKDGKAALLSDYRGKKTELVHFASW